LAIYDIYIVTLLGFITILSDTFRCFSNSILTFYLKLVKFWYM